MAPRAISERLEILARSPDQAFHLLLVGKASPCGPPSLPGSCWLGNAGVVNACGLLLLGRAQFNSEPLHCSITAGRAGHLLLACGSRLALHGALDTSACHHRSPPLPPLEESALKYVRGAPFKHSITVVVRPRHSFPAKSSVLPRSPGPLALVFHKQQILLQ